METTTFETSVGYSPDPTFSADLVAGYHNVNISGGRDGGRAQPGTIPAFSSTLPGISGDSLFSLGIEVTHDTRNQKDNSTSGGKRSFGWRYYEGLNSSDARYFKFDTDISQHFRLGSDRRVFVARMYAEHNAELGNGYVPFHQMAKVGGHGRRGNRLSETLRGYAHNRFFDESAVLFNLEYRYTVWEYRQFKGDAVLFWDQGQAFGELSEFQMKDFRESYGAGLRFSLANIVLLSLEVAHGDEGTNLFVKSYAPF
jgi:outer membrane protein assembly factor BamA